VVSQNHPKSPAYLQLPSRAGLDRFSNERALGTQDTHTQFLSIVRSNCQSGVKQSNQIQMPNFSGIGTLTSAETPEGPFNVFDKERRGLAHPAACASYRLVYFACADNLV
jgi:hypothetical protein